VTLSERSLGWLRTLDAKVATPDSRHPDEAEPLWDDRTVAPSAGGVRGDLVESALAMALMARRTPAWTERMRIVVDGLLDRILRPAPAAPGDATATDATAHRSAVALLLGLRAAIVATDADRVEREPFALPDDDDPDRRWTHAGLAGDLAGRLAAETRPDIGAMATLALLLADRAHGSDHHSRAAAPWWAAARHELGLDRAGPAPAADDGEGAPHPLAAVPAQVLLATSCWLAPCAADDARRLFDAGCAAAGLDRADPADALAAGPEAVHLAATALLLARNWGLDERTGALSRALEAVTEPVADAASGRFWWGLGLHGDVLRGRPNAMLAAAESCGTGRWSALAGPMPAACPQLVDLDFPRLALTRAEWSNGCLVLRLTVLDEQRSVFSSFRLVGAEPRIWCMSGLDGVSTDVTSREVIIRLPLRSGELEFTPGSY